MVDDEPESLDLVHDMLTSSGYLVKVLSESRFVLNTIRTFRPDVVILDLSMPDIDGIEMCHQIRGQYYFKDIFIIILTDRPEEYTEIAAFESGANDYIHKPVKPRALVKRINAILKRLNNDRKGLENIKHRDLEIETKDFLVRRGDKNILLSKIQFQILYHMASQPGIIFSREQLLKEIWGNAFITTRTVDVHIRKIRERVGDGVIRTVKGVGYKYDYA